MLEVSKTADRVPWRPTIAKALIVLLFPLGIGYSFGGFYLISALLIIGPIPFSFFDSLLITLFSIIFLLPGIYIERRIKSKPVANSVRKSVIVVTIAIWLVSFFVSLIAMPIVPMMLFLHLPSVYIPILSISFFIILPLLNREFIIRQTPEKYHMRSYVELSESYKQHFGKRRFLPLLIWSGLLFSPLFSFGPWQINIVSLLYNVLMDVGGPIYTVAINQFIYSVISVSGLVAHFLIFSLRFVFIRDLFLFSKGEVSQSRLISMGVLSEIAPAAMLTLQQFALIIVLEMPFGYYSWILPTPLFPLLGYLFARKSRYTDQSDYFWDDLEQKMRFDKEPQPMDLHIKIPVSYLIRSRLRKLRR
jgi:hypothetical protein